MTIDAGWTKTTKTLAPGAFSATRPVELGQQRHVVFFDGQIKLMKADYIKTWAEFLRLQFYQPIEHAIAGGAAVVVLGFDDYKHVPVAKTPTQRKRSNHVKALSFEEADELPPLMPDEWAGAMRNRVFKTKVVGLIVRNVVERFKQGSHTVIIDWVGAPKVYGPSIELPPLLQASSEEGDEPRRGECDVKAFAWSALGMPLLIESTDGDFVPMSLLHLERRALDDGSDRVPHIYLHRLKTNIGTAKRGSGGKAKREYEFVHVNVIYTTLENEMRAQGQVAPAPVLGAPDSGPRITTAQLFALLVASTGCDFCLNLPGIGPGKLWNMRNGAVLMPGVARDRRSELWATHPCEVLLHMCIVLYRDAYKKHLSGLGRRLVSSPEESIDSLRCKYTLIYNAVMRESGLGVPRIAPWPVERMLAHVRNTIWTLQYWSELHAFPDPLACDQDGHDRFGFKLHKQRVVFVGT